MARRKQSDAPVHDTQACASLRAALVSLMLEKPFDRISVQELCATACVSRSTFYAYFENTDELLREVESIHVGAVSALNEDITDPGVVDMGFYTKTLAYVEAHADDFRALLVTSPDARFREKWKDAIKTHLRARRASARKPALSKLALEAAAASVISAYVYLLANPGTVSSGEAIAVVQGAMTALDS